MLAATKAVDGGAGVVFIVKNYTGDVLNFRMAAELAGTTASRSSRCSRTTTSPSRTASTRPAGAASASTVLVEKIAGAKAEAGGTLAEVAASRAR